MEIKVPLAKNVQIKESDSHLTAGPDATKAVLPETYERIGCASCGSAHPPGSRYGDGKRPNRKEWLALEQNLAAHGGPVLIDPFAEIELEPERN